MAFSPVAPYDLAVAAAIRVSLRSGDDYERKKSVCKEFNNVQSIGMRSDGRLLAVGTGSGEIMVINMATKTVLRKLVGHRAAIHGLRFLPNKSNLISTSDDKTVFLWDITTGAEVWSSRSNGDFVRACGVSSSPSSSLFITGSYDHSVSLWDASSPKPLLKMDHGSPVEAVALLPGDGMAVSAGLSSIKLWNLTEGGRMLQEIVIHHKTISALTVSKDGKYLISSSIDQSVKILRLSDFTISHQFKFKSAVMSVAISEDGKRIAAGLSSGKLVVLSFQAPRRSQKEEPLFGKRKTEPAPIVAEESYVIMKEKYAPLMKFDKHLKSFRYHDAFDAVLKKKNAQLLASAIGELIRRDGLVAALSGRTEVELSPLLAIICKYISSPRHASLLLEAGFAILEIYSPMVGQSKSFGHELRGLRAALDRQIRAQRLMMELEGGLDLLISSNRLSQSDGVAVAQDQDALHHF